MRPGRIGSAEAERKYPTAVRHIRDVATEAAWLNACLDAMRADGKPADRVLALEDAKASVAALRASAAVQTGFAFVTGLDDVEAQLRDAEAEYRARGFYLLAAHLLKGPRSC